MSRATLIDGKAIAADIRENLRQEARAMNPRPTLAVILVGDDPASQVYVKNKIKACEDVGITSKEFRLPQDQDAAGVAKTISALNQDPAVNGILLQLPLPEHLSVNQESLVQQITPEKDVDGLTTLNAGKLALGYDDGLVPCTPQGALKLLQSVQKDLTGMHAVVIGRSNLFGKPMGQLLLRENCTVTTAHSRTRDLDKVCKQADIIIAAVGQPKMVQVDWIKDDAIVIDVGINRLDNGKLCGDVDFETVSQRASAITPVPGGVGPMTIACLLSNTLQATKMQKE